MCVCMIVQEEIQTHEETEKKLQDQIKSLTTDIETQHGQLLACRQQIDQLKVDKEAVYRGMNCVEEFLSLLSYLLWQ